MTNKNRKEEKRLYYQLNKEKIKIVHKTYRLNNKDKIKIYLETNKDKIRATKKAWREIHKEEKRASMKIYAKVHSEKFLSATNRRRAKKASVVNVPIRSDILKYLKLVWDDSCAYCKNHSDKYHMDHFLPLELAGHHAEYNLVLACPTCNLSKGPKHPQVWLKEMGYSFIKPDYMC